MTCQGVVEMAFKTPSAIRCRACRRQPGFNSKTAGARRGVIPPATTHGHSHPRQLKRGGAREEVPILNYIPGD